MSLRVELIIFAKAPVPGRVKTRLISRLGEKGATDIHIKLTEHTVRTATSSSRLKVGLWCSPDTDHPFFQSLQAKYNLDLYQQQGNDLGQRMAYALDHTLQANDVAIIVGADCPILGIQDIEYIVNKLVTGCDAAIIPAEDGGYVLLGLRKYSPVIFQNIDWGSGRVFEQTRVKLNKLDWNWYQHETLWDVDRPEDIDRLSSLGFELF